MNRVLFIINILCSILLTGVTLFILLNYESDFLQKPIYTFFISISEFYVPRTLHPSINAG